MVCTFLKWHSYLLWSAYTTWCDMLMSDNIGELERSKKKLAKDYEIKDLGTLKYFLRIEFSRSKESIFVTQHKYVLYLLGYTGLIG